MFFAGMDTAICTGHSITLSGSGASSYAWNQNVQDGISFTPIITNSYIVTGTDGNNCSNADTVTVTVNALPNVFAGMDTSVCTGSNVTLSGSGASAYTWNQNVQDGISFMPLITNSYIVTGTDGNNCSNTDTVIVTVNSLPNVVLNYTGATSFCINDGSQLITGESPLGGSFAGPGTSGGTFDPGTAGIGSHAVTYTYTDANGCTNQAMVMLDVTGCLGTENPKDIALQAWPNPGTDMVSVYLPGAADLLVFIAADGKIIYETRPEGCRCYRSIPVVSLPGFIRFVLIAGKRSIPFAGCGTKNT